MTHPHRHSLLRAALAAVALAVLNGCVPLPLRGPLPPPPPPPPPLPPPLPLAAGPAAQGAAPGFLIVAQPRHAAGGDGHLHTQGLLT